MAIRRKAGVIGEPQPALAWGLAIAARVYGWFGLADLVITSLRDGNHMAGSLHPRGYAADLRTSDVPPATRPAIAATLKAELGPAFDVVLEVDHIHVEFDPEDNGGKNLPNLPAGAVIPQS
jgi:hypothetical protein